ncbi:hypothetical protein BB558_007165 [Smittium angustum]|uniref:Uncharacterized protein n=1 Tax=Smittium angustum TaxID=133377 RepID=A0A2U1IVT2_SMIAN|nr:hypothetical protein BB558_007165 [Smittium angustum]
MNNIICNSANIKSVLSNNISLFQAVELISHSWGKITKETIINCFNVLYPNIETITNQETIETNLELNDMYFSTYSNFIGTMKIKNHLNKDKYLCLEETVIENVADSTDLNILYNEILKNFKNKKITASENESGRKRAKILKLVSDLKVLNYEVAPDLSELLINYEVELKKISIVYNCYLLNQSLIFNTI